MESALYGLKLPVQDDGAPEITYMTIVLTPTAALTEGTLNMKMGAVPWSTDYAFSAKATPTPVTPLTDVQIAAGHTGGA